MQTKLMGTDHVYNVDTFNEMNPASSDPGYLANTSAAVFAGMRAADPDAIWLMQGWLFLSGFWNANTVKPYLDAVPNSGMIILDLYTEAVPIWSRYESYYGKPYVWCMLHNFGGRRSLCGNLTRIATQPAIDRVSSTMAGVGLTPEAIEQNPVVYEMMLETGWTTEAIDVPSWITEYVHGRYGATIGSNADLQEAWSTLTSSVYQFNFGQTFLGTLHRSPGIPSVKETLEYDADPRDPSTFGYTSKQRVAHQFEQQQQHSDRLGYDFAGVTSAWRNMVSGAAAAKSQSKSGGISGPLSYDLVDVGRQVLVDAHADLVTLASAAYIKWKKNGTDTSAELAVVGTALLGIIIDLDSLLIRDPNYLLGNWIETAKTWGTNDVERRRMEANARYQITLWGPSGQINDYAEKHWAGLVGTYYYGRWRLWINTLQTAVKTGKPVDTGAYGHDLLTWEQAWCQSNNSYTTVPYTDVVGTSQQLLKKYTTTTVQYVKKPNTVVNGFDVHAPTKLVSTDPMQLKLFCNLVPSCVGFISTGYLKVNVTQSSPMQGVDLYIKSG